MRTNTPNFEFGEFLLDTRERVLLRDGKPLSITPKAFQLLRVLVENQGHIVEKDQLMKLVWADSFVEEGNITFTVALLRKLLEEDAKAPRFIETVARRGYRFIANVIKVETREELPEFSDPPETARPETSSNANFAVERFGNVVAVTDWQDAANKDIDEEPEGKNLLRLVPPVVTRWPGQFFWLAVWSSVVIFAGICFVWYVTSNQRLELSAKKLTRLTSNGKINTAAVSPDGKFIAYVVEDEGQFSLWLKNIAAGGNDMQIRPPVENVELGSVRFSPESERIYYRAGKTLYQVPILGGLPKEVLQNFYLGSGPITFSPDGKQFAFLRFSTTEEWTALTIANADGTNEKTLALSNPPGYFGGSPAWSPNNKVIALRAFKDQRTVVATVQVDNGAVALSIPASSVRLNGDLAWRPDGNALFAMGTDDEYSRQIWSFSYPGGEARNITNDLNRYQSFSLTADGRALVAVMTEQRAHIWVMSSGETSRTRQLTHGIDSLDGIYALNWMPDNKIVYEAAARNGKNEVWMLDAEGRNPRQIADKPLSTVSPDGKYLVYLNRYSEEPAGLFKLDLGTGERQRLTTGVDKWPTFSPDGKWLFFTRYAEDASLWKASIDGGDAVELINNVDSQFSPAVSPNGELIAFYWMGSASQPPAIALMPADGGEIIKTFSLPDRGPMVPSKNALNWTPDGQAVVYLSVENGVSNLQRQPIDGSPSVPVTNFDSGRIFNFAYSPDGKQIALSRGTINRDVVLINNPE